MTAPGAGGLDLPHPPMTMKKNNQQYPLRTAVPQSGGRRESKWPRIM
jgi:hypothetical protein